MGLHHRRHRVQVAAVELAEGGDAEQAEHLVHLVLQQPQHRATPASAGRGERVAVSRPMPTSSAPSAIALTMSVPRQKPPSIQTLARPSTASTTSGSTSIAPRPWSSCRPPWLET